MSEYIINDEQLMSERRQAYEAGKRKREVWTARVYHGEEIVRCRDCLHYSGYSASHAKEEIGTCNLGLEWTDLYSIVEPSGFCAWGERRDA